MSSVGPFGAWLSHPRALRSSGVGWGSGDDDLDAGEMPSGLGAEAFEPPFPALPPRGPGEPQQPEWRAGTERAFAAVDQADPADPADAGVPRRRPPGAADGFASRPRVWVIVAAAAALAAGAVEASAAGSYRDSWGLAALLTGVALGQIAWGAVAVAGWRRVLAPVAVVVNGAALVVWTLSGAAGTGGPSRFAGVVSVSLAIVSAVGATVVAGAPGDDLAGPAHLGGRPAGGEAGERRPPALVVAVVVAALALAAPAMVLVGGRHPGPGTGGAAPGGAPPAFDAQLPVDFSGVAGVTPAEQARAEDLATRTLQRVPDLAAGGPDEVDAARLHDLGYHSIGDGGSGYEHWVDWPAIDDDHVLDPEHPEALVFRVDGPGRRTLAAAIYMMRSGDRMGDQPDVGGALTPWHVVEDLCYRGDANRWVVGDVARPSEPCGPGTFRLGDPMPMLYAWVVPQECGPFAVIDHAGEATGSGVVPPAAVIC